uniref:Uncharacterized protein n=1 Tax=Anguilla anguilla TaxID=7936 RepID=A0A0E9T7Z3_ANGAN
MVKTACHTTTHSVPADWLKLSKCGLGLYLDGSPPGNTELLLEVVLLGQQGAVFLWSNNPNAQCSDGDEMPSFG